MFCKLQDDGQSLMRAAASQMNLSACAYRRILKRARTIADLARSEEIQSAHLAEALQYRPKLMTGWMKTKRYDYVIGDLTEIFDPF
jgi:magnesium chelatase family protein